MSGDKPSILSVSSTVSDKFSQKTPTWSPVSYLKKYDMHKNLKKCIIKIIVLFLHLYSHMQILTQLQCLKCQILNECKIDLMPENEAPFVRPH